MSLLKPMGGSWRREPHVYIVFSQALYRFPTHMPGQYSVLLQRQRLFFYPGHQYPTYMGGLRRGLGLAIIGLGSCFVCRNHEVIGLLVNTTKQTDRSASDSILKACVPHGSLRAPLAMDGRFSGPVARRPPHSSALDAMEVHPAPLKSPPSTPIPTPSTTTPKTCPSLPQETSWMKKPSVRSASNPSASVSDSWGRNRT